MTQPNEVPPSDSKEIQSVMHIFNGLSPSGMERMLLSAAPYSPIPNNKITVVGQGKNNPFAASLQEAGYSVRVVPVITSPHGFLSLLKLLREIRPSIVHIHTEGTYAQAVLATRIASKATPIVRSIHSIFRKKKAAAAYRRVVSITLDRFVTNFVACSPEVADFEEDFGRSTGVVWNWVDDRFFRLREGQFLPTAGVVAYLMVGNCSWIKNHTMALRALQAAAGAEALDFRLSHFGMEDKCDSAERMLLDSWDKRGRLSHRGPGDPAEGMRQRPTFLMPSLHEGMGVALAEAIVVGLPAVVADVPGLQWAREFPNVRHVANSVETWTEALLRPSKLSSGREVDVQRFSAIKGITAYFALYASALQQVHDQRGLKSSRLQWKFKR